MEGLLEAVQSTDRDWGARTASNLPALKTTAGEMAVALERVAGTAAAALIDWTPDPFITKIVTSWPADIHAARARRLGLRADADFETIIHDYISENPNAVTLAVHP